MMPFSVLRIWFTGLLGWVILGAAAYLLWEWADGIDPAPLVAAHDARTGEIIVDAPPQQDRDRRGGWPYLAAGLGLIAISLIGWLPIGLALSRWGGGFSPRQNRTGKVSVVERPDGSRLHVETFGGEGAPTLLFTHGWSLDGTVWAEVLGKLEGRFRIVVWDLPGLGRSRGPTNRDYRLEKMADDLAAVAASVGGGPVILIGHSIGGMIVQTFCRQHPQEVGARVAGIVLLHSTYTNPLATAFGRRFWKTIERPILIPLNQLTLWLAPLAWLSNWQSFLNGNLHIATRLASFSGQQSWAQLHYAAWLAAIAWPAVVARGNLAMVQFDEQQTLPKVDIPVLVVAARHDRMTCPDASDRLAKLLPQSIETSIKAGHLSFWERPDELAAILTEFAERVGKRSTRKTVAKIQA
jgi:pimeloyl-ACP methyl ester carboxylesterase